MTRRNFLTMIGIGAVAVALPAEAFNLPVETISPEPEPESVIVPTPELVSVEYPPIYGSYYPRFQWTFPVGVYTTHRVIGTLALQSAIPVQQISERHAFSELEQGIVARMWYAYKTDPVVAKKWNDYRENLLQGNKTDAPYKIVKLGAHRYNHSNPMAELYGYRAALVETDYRTVDKDRSSLYLQTIALHPSDSHFECIRTKGCLAEGYLCERFRFSLMTLSGVNFMSYDAPELPMDASLPYKDFSNVDWIREQIRDLHRTKNEWMGNARPEAVMYAMRLADFHPAHLIQSTLTVSF